MTRQRRGWYVGVAAVVVLGATVAVTVWAQDREKAKQRPGPGQEAPDPQQMAQMMKAWQASITPGEGHRKLQPFVGKWKTTTKVWWQPGAEPIVTEGEAENTWVLRGRYLRGTHKGQLMAPDANGVPTMQPFEGEGLMGFNNARQIYEGSWADTMSTAILTYSGTADPDGKVFRFYGQMDEPMMGMYGRTVKYVDRIVDDDTLVFELYDLAAGDDHKVLEITYKRQ